MDDGSRAQETKGPCGRVGVGFNKRMRYGGSREDEGGRWKGEGKSGRVSRKEGEEGR